MNTNNQATYIAVRFERGETGSFSEKEYTYKAVKPCAVGDIIHIPTRRGFSYGLVTRVNVPETDIAPEIRQRLVTLDCIKPKHLPPRLERAAGQTALF